MREYMERQREIARAYIEEHGCSLRARVGFLKDVVLGGILSTVSLFFGVPFCIVMALCLVNELRKIAVGLFCLLFG